MAKLLVRGLVEEGHQVDAVATLASATSRTTTLDYDVVILDWGLPDGDGLGWLEQKRTSGWSVPVLMLTARGSVEERIVGLRAGADDYLAKPFSFEELMARLDALHRRTHGSTARVVALATLSFS